MNSDILGFSLRDPGYLNAYRMSLKGPFIGLLMQYLQKNSVRRGYVAAGLGQMCNNRL